MAYTPELSDQLSCTLRRIAWALDLPMTKTLEGIFEYLITIIDSKRICEMCRDKSRCENCGFNKESKDSNILYLKQPERKEKIYYEYKQYDNTGKDF